MKKNKLLMISFILGALYSLYLVLYFAGAIGSADEAGKAIGASIATAIVMPHMITTVLATIFNGLGFYLNKSGFALTGAILYAVAMVVFLVYAPFVMIQMILSFIGFSQLRKALKEA